MVAPQSQRPGRWQEWHADQTPLRLGVSACLLGQKVRFDGGHARNRFVDDVLGTWIEWVPVCPEVEMGMSIPRPTIRLVEDEKGLRLVAPKTGEDFTAGMAEYAKRRVDELDAEGLDGYVLKKSSPSCGMERLRVYDAESGGVRRRNGVGMFAARLLEACPHLPVEEEGRLNDAELRENFIERIFVRNRWRNFTAQGLDRGRLVEFHTAHKLLLWSHNEAGMRRMGRLLGDAGKGKDAALFVAYEEELHTTMRSRTTRKHHVNVLQHAAGYLKNVLDPRDKREIQSALEDFRQGWLPLIVPVTLLRFNIRKYDVDYLLGQLYFDPHPKELLLRNHV